MRCERFGKQQLTEEQRREAKQIASEARARFGSTENAAKALGIPKGTLTVVASGTSSAGMTTYKRLKKYAESTREVP